MVFLCFRMIAHEDVGRQTAVGDDASDGCHTVHIPCTGVFAVHQFKYSERPGTYASKHLPDDVPEETKLRRLSEMINLQNELSAESYRKDIGKEYEVLVEGFSKRSRAQLFGRTGQNKVVVFDKGNHHIGDFVKVRILDSSSATLKGEALD